MSNITTAFIITRRVTVIRKKKSLRESKLQSCQYHRYSNSIQGEDTTSRFCIHVYNFTLRYKFSFASFTERKKEEDPGSKDIESDSHTKGVDESGIRGDISRGRLWELWIAYLPMKGIEDTWGATHGDGNPKPPDRSIATDMSCAQRISRREKALFRPRPQIIFLLMQRARVKPPR